MNSTRRLAVSVVFALSASVLLAADKPAHTVTGKIIHIVDGDTADVLDTDNATHRIRLSGIDTPEIGRGKNQPGQPFGQKSRQLLQELIDGKHVRVEWRGRDRYERILGDIFVRDESGREVWVNREMIRQGMAWHYSHYDKRKPLADAEIEAREAKRGLWVDKSPVPPWEWRKKARSATAE